MGAARPARTDHGHEDLHLIAYRERGLALHALRAALEHYAGDAWVWVAEEEIYVLRQHDPSRAKEALEKWRGVNDTDAEG